MFHSKYILILHHCWDKAKYFVDCNLPHLYLVSPLVVTPLDFGRHLWHHLAIVWSCLHDPRFNHLHGTPTCDGQTDGRIHDDSVYHTSIASHGKNWSERTIDKMQLEVSDFASVPPRGTVVETCKKCIIFDSGWFAVLWKHDVIDKTVTQKYVTYP